MGRLGANIGNSSTASYATLERLYNEKGLEKSSDLLVARTYAILFLASALVATGCGDPVAKTYEVTGTVSYNGKNLPRGIVSFYPQSGRPLKPASIDASGNYTLEAPAGEYGVAIVAMPESPKNDGEKIHKNPEAGGAAVFLRPLIPQRYEHPQTSGIQVKVEPDGLKRFDFALK